MGKQRQCPHAELTPEFIIRLSEEFEAGSCIPELMERYGWCRNKITKLLRQQLGPRYKAIAKKIAQDRRIDGSRKANNLRRGFKQTPEWIAKRVLRVRGQKRTAVQRLHISIAALARKSTGRDAESYKRAGAKAKDTKLKNGSYDRHSKFLAELHASGKFYANESHRYGVKSTYVSNKTGIITRCDSNFERSRMEQLDADQTVIWWTKKHHIIIPYITSSGQTRRFIPDFLITFSDQTQMIEELKGRNYEPEVNRLKFEALKFYCQERGLRAQWTWQKIKDQF